MSLGDLFLGTHTSSGVGRTAKLEFLVEEGRIRADTIVRRVEPGRWIGTEVHGSA